MKQNRTYYALTNNNLNIAYSENNYSMLWLYNNLYKDAIFSELLIHNCLHNNNQQMHRPTTHIMNGYYYRKLSVSTKLDRRLHARAKN